MDQNEPPNNFNCRCTMSQRDRRDVYSEKMRLVEIVGVSFMEYVTDDLYDEELQKHFDLAMSKENYEYCQALACEAIKRKIKLKV